MSQEDNTVQCLNYSELIRVLQGLCKEKQSGVMVISSESGSTARFTLEQGEIFDVSFAGQTEKLALLQIKKITRGKTAFFKRAQGNSAKLISLSTDEVFSILNDFTPSHQEKLDNKPQVNTGDFNVIEAYLTTIIGPIAQIIYQDYQNEILQVDTLAKLGTIIEKIAEQVLLAEEQKLFKQDIRQFIAQCGTKDQTALLNILKSSVKELTLHPQTLSLLIQKSISYGDAANLLLSKLVTHIERTENLIELISMFDILRFLEKTNKTGLLSIQSHGKKAGFYFDQGALVNAFDDSRHGVDVALELLQWDVDYMRFTSMERTNVAKEITQSVDVLINSFRASFANKEALKQHTARTEKQLTADEIQAALSKQIQHLQNKEADKNSLTDYQTYLTKAILFAESYENTKAEQLLVSLLHKNDKLFDAWFWLARVLTNMTAIEFALKKAAQINTKSAELMEEVKKFTTARKVPKGDLVLRCPFCWMPIHAKHTECPHCLADFFIHKSFFNTIGKAKNDPLDHAIARYSKVLHQHEINADDIYTLFYLAMAYLNRQYYQESLSQFSELIKLAPQHSVLLNQYKLLVQYMQSKGLLSETKESLKSQAMLAAKILVVEDSIVTRKVIVRTLTSAGYEVFEAKDAEEALTDIEAKQLNLVLLDIILPGDKDGYAILAEIKTKPSLLNVPVIMLTSRDSLFDKLKGKVSDADEYLTKPFQPDELLAVVKKYLK